MTVGNTDNRANSRCNSAPGTTDLIPRAPRKRPSQGRSQHTVDVIVEAATRIFDKVGIQATTNQIAELAGVSIGSLYQYFPNKQALIHDVVLNPRADADDLTTAKKIARALGGYLDYFALTR